MNNSSRFIFRKEANDIPVENRQQTRDVHDRHPNNVEGKKSIYRSTHFVYDRKLTISNSFKYSN